MLPLLLSLLISTAHAETLTTWDFSGGQVPVNFNVTGWEVQPSRQGLLIQTKEEGSMVYKGKLPAKPDVVRFVIQSDHTLEASLGWKNPRITDDFLHLPFVIEKTDELQEVDIDLTQTEEWYHRTDIFGLAFPEGATVILKEISFIEYGMFDRLAQGLKSFWTFDDFQIHSINYLWGPILTTTPAATEYMFVNDPPTGMRAAWIVLGLFVFLVVLSSWILRKDSKRKWSVLFVLFSAFWILSDLRMGSEILSYVRDDFRTFIGNEEPTLRELENIHRVLEESLPELSKHDQYLLLVPEASILTAISRYTTYPSIPVSKLTPSDQPQLALVFERNDIALTEDGILLSRKDGTVYGSGTLLQIFDNDTALVSLQVSQ